MSLFRKDENGNIVRTAGNIIQRWNNKIFNTTHSIENGNDYYDIDPTANKFIQGLTDFTEFQLLIMTPNETPNVFIRFGGQSFPLKRSDTDAIAIRSLYRRLDCYTLDDQTMWIDPRLQPTPDSFRGVFKYALESWQSINPTKMIEGDTLIILSSKQPYRYTGATWQAVGNPLTPLNGWHWLIEIFADYQFGNGKIVWNEAIDNWSIYTARVPRPDEVTIVTDPETLQFSIGNLPTQLIAGENINIEDNIISADLQNLPERTDTLETKLNTITTADINTTEVETSLGTTQAEVNQILIEKIDTKQEQLIAGENINIEDNIISANIELDDLMLSGTTLYKAVTIRPNQVPSTAAAQWQNFYVVKVKAERSVLSLDVSRYLYFRVATTAHGARFHGHYLVEIQGRSNSNFTVIGQIVRFTGINNWVNTISYTNLLNLHARTITTSPSEAEFELGIRINGTPSQSVVPWMNVTVYEYTTLDKINGESSIRFEPIEPMAFVLGNHAIGSNWTTNHSQSPETRLDIMHQRLWAASDLQNSRQWEWVEGTNPWQIILSTWLPESVAPAADPHNLATRRFELTFISSDRNYTETYYAKYTILAGIIPPPTGIGSVGVVEVREFSLIEASHAEWLNLYIGRNAGLSAQLTVYANGSVANTPKRAIVSISNVGVIGTAGPASDWSGGTIIHHRSNLAARPVLEELSTRAINKIGFHLYGLGTGSIETVNGLTTNGDILFTQNNTGLSFGANARIQVGSNRSMFLIQASGNADAHNRRIVMRPNMQGAAHAHEAALFGDGRFNAFILTENNQRVATQDFVQQAVTNRPTATVQELLDTSSTGTFTIPNVSNVRTDTIFSFILRMTTGPWQGGHQDFRGYLLLGGGQLRWAPQVNVAHSGTVGSPTEGVATAQVCRISSIIQLNLSTNVLTVNINAITASTRVQILRIG